MINICSNLNLSLNDYLFIRECFYLCDQKEYENHFNDFKILNEDSCNAKKIYTLFKEWKSYSYYNLGLLRGNFLEILSYNLLNSHFKTDVKYRESKIFLDNYYSHTWDIIIRVEELYYLYE